MRVIEKTDSNNRTIIETTVTEISAGVFDRRLRVYSASGYAFDIYIADEFETTIKTFAIEDYPQFFITPFPNTQQGYVRVELEYKPKSFGNWFVYEDQKYEIRYTIRANKETAPTVSMELSFDGLSNGYNMVGTTSVLASFSSATKYGAGVSSYTLNVDNKNYGAPYKSDVLKTGGWLTVTGTVTDTRGMTASATQQIWVMANMPSLEAISPSGALDQAIGYTFIPANKDAYSKLKIECLVNGSYNEVETKDLGRADGKTSGNISISKLSETYAKYPNTADVPLRFTLLTYKTANSGQLAETYSKEAVVKIPDNEDTKPQITSATVIPSERWEGIPALYVKGKNGAKVNATASGKCGASVQGPNITWSVEGRNYDNGASSSKFESYGEKSIFISATDSRGFTRTRTEKIVVEDYFKPMVTAIKGATKIIVVRANAEGEADDTGTYLLVQAGQSFSSLTGANTCEMSCNYKVYKGTQHTAILLPKGKTVDFNGIVKDSEMKAITINQEYVYTVEIQVKDALGEVGIYKAMIASEHVFMDRAGSRGSIAFGGHVQMDNAFEVYQGAYFHGGMAITDFAEGGNTIYRIYVDGNGYLKAEAITTYRRTKQ